MNQFYCYTMASSQESVHDTEEILTIHSQSSLQSDSSVNALAEHVILVDDFEVQDFDCNTRKRKHPIPLIETSQLESPTTKHNLSADLEYNCCSICYEPWMSAGLHRLVSLKCGHLFGESCIDKWLRQNTNSSDRKCPQCKKLVSFKDIRPIYASKLIAVDNSELESALKKLESEKAVSIQAKKSETNMALRYQLSLAECERLKGQVKHLEMKLENTLKNKNDLDSNDYMEVVCCNETSQQELSVQKVKDIFLTSAGGCRILEINPSLGMILVSRPSTVSLYRGYGLVKISCRDLKEYQFVPIHTNVIRDLKFSPNKDDLLLSVSTDKTAKLTNIASNSNVTSFVLSAQSWACCWDLDDSNYFYTALNNGHIEQFDIRQINSCVSNLFCGISKPITSISCIPSSSIGGMLVATISGCSFIEKNNINNFTPSILPDLSGNCTSVSYDPVHAKFLASFRPTLTMPNTRHAVCEISRCFPSSENVEPFITSTQVHQFTGGSSQTTLSRSHIFTPLSRQSELCLAFGDESARSLEICNTSTSKKLTCYTSSKPVVDVKYYSNFVTALTEDKLFIYELK